MTPEEFATRMAELEKDDSIEGRHQDMDCLMEEALRSLGYGKGCDIYENALKWWA